MNNREGFVVVQKSLNSWEAHHNPKYQGVDRLVPWTMENYSKGFDDPYESAKYAKEGLIHNLPLANEVLQIFTEIVEPDNLEIIYIRERTRVEELTALLDSEYKSLGFDVAGNGSPFYSIVSDFPPPSEASFHVFGEQLNENGLFDSVVVAKDYFDAYLERYPEEQDQGIVIWEVYLVSQNTSQA